MGYKIDNQFTETTYNFFVETGSDDLLTFPKRTLPTNKKWAEVNGTEWDLLNPVFDDAILNLYGTIEASSEVDFWNKYNALWIKVSQAGETKIFSTELNKTFKVFYLEMTKVQRLTRIQGVNTIVVYISIQFRVLWPVLGTVGES